MLELVTGIILATSRSRFSLAGIRIAYFTPRLSSASSISGLVKAASVRNITSLSSFCSLSISGSRSSFQPSALCTLPGRSFAAKTIAVSAE
jgi:hypothetical protein